jgi:hypothetical protein
MIENVRNEYVTIIERKGSGANYYIREFWAGGKRLGEFAFTPDPVTASSKPDPRPVYGTPEWESECGERAKERGEPVYKAGDRVVVKQTKSPNLTVGKTYAITEARIGWCNQYLVLENDKARNSEIKADKVRLAGPDEQML